MHRHNSSADERRALLVAEGDAAARAQAEGALDDPDEREDGEDERGPVHEARRGLVREDGPERPCNRDRGGEVTFRRGEGVRRGRALEEEPVRQKSKVGETRRSGGCGME